MAEPATPTATLTVAALSGAVGIPVSLAMGDYGVVLLSSLAAALVQVSAKDATNDKSAWMTMLRIIVVSLALSTAATWMLIAMWPDALPKPPFHVALALCSFFIGLADGNWKTICKEGWAWLKEVSPFARKKAE